MLVVHLQWSDRSTTHQETYGPWIPDDDMTHVAAIEGFLRDHQRLTGCRFDTAMMANVVDPAGWVREREQRAEADAATIRRGVVSAAEISGDGL